MFQQDNWSIYRKKRPPIIRKPRNTIRFFNKLLETNRTPEKIDLPQYMALSKIVIHCHFTLTLISDYDIIMLTENTNYPHWNL